MVVSCVKVVKFAIKGIEWFVMAVSCIKVVKFAMKGTFGCVVWLF